MVEGLQITFKAPRTPGYGFLLPTTSCATLPDPCLESVQQNDVDSLLNTSGDALQCRNQVF
jgi:hypothetical protein